ncbi:dihydrolipoamide acetyltransferase family protein [Halocatena marina]|uniref:Dihydrolipoamide acetyltransferase family protein n=1 Tax=Halocatena marina TaxID=2934937 RepID=A0ABD5YTZ8_9EURY|nr:dihydrolipoamide acetyltransferase family protein [Halocatena marina]
MVREFKLPDVGEGVAEGEIVSWLVEAGDPVEEDQPVAEVETDKAVVDVPSPVNGTVAELRAEEGEVVPVGDVIIVFTVGGEEQQQKSDTESEDSDPTDSAETDTDTSSRVFAAPSARRLARELGVDISAVDGSGPGGRISGSDVRAHAEGSDPEPASNTAEPSEATDVEPVTEDVSDTTTPRSVPSSSADREQTLAAPATRKLAEEHEIDINTVPTDEEHDGQPFVTPEQVRSFAETQQAAQQADARAMQTAGPSEREERIPYRGIRRTIGKQMERSKYTAPHVTHHDEVDVTELVETRSDLKQVAEEQGVSLTYMPFVMKAVVAGLKEFPYLNSSLDETSDEIILKNYYNIGVGVATDAGLMVPVVDDVDRKGLLQIASEMNERVLKARERSITREEMQGGTFTITNFGAVGGEYATPIINYPETAILGLGEIKEKPRVVDGEVVPRKVMTLSLSIDHRVIDGAIAGQFANTVKRYLNNPSLLLLE